MNDILIETKSILVHCFTANGGAGNAFSTGKNIYERISNSINEDYEISASSIKEGDGIGNGKNNLFGPVAIILSDGEITYANEIDAGTYVTEIGKREKDSDARPNRNDIVTAIDNRNPNTYNELCIRNYKVIGFIICMDDQRFLLQNIISEEMLYENIQSYNLPYFFLSDGLLRVCKFEEKTKRFIFDSNISFEDIYKD